MSLSADLGRLRAGGGAPDTLEKQLLCPICSQIFTKPVVILPCQHNLCRKCANELYQPSLFQARTTMQVNSGRFRCPSCRQEVVLDRHGVYGLQRNLLVENIIDVYKETINDTTSPLPSAPPPDQFPTCSDHEGEKVNIYCLTCKVPTCSLCKVFGAHQSCQVAPLTDIYEKQKDELREEVTSLAAFSARVQAVISDLEKSCRNVEENCKTQKQSVCEKFSHIVSILEDRHKAMTQKIKSEQEEKIAHVQKLLRHYGDSMEANSKLMETAQTSMEDQDEVAFVQNSKQLITRVMAAATSCPSETLKPGYEKMSDYRFNFSKEETALRSIDFIKVVRFTPEEPEVDSEPEDLKEPEAEQHEETLVQNQEAFVKTIEESETALVSPPPLHVEPAEREETAVLPAPALARVPAWDPARDPARDPLASDQAGETGRDPVESVEEPMQLDKEDLDSSEGHGQITTGGREERVESREKVETSGGHHPVEEENVCDQEGMSTQQAVTILFYLLAFLLILQRVWAYVGCFL